MSIIKQLDIKKHINIETLRQFFTDVKLDGNDKKLYGIKPFRSRQILFTKYVNESLKIINKKNFTQNVSDVRKSKRRFSVFKPTKKQLELLQNLLEYATSRINAEALSKKLEVTFHFVKIYASEEGSTNSPEGIHRDGYDILVPCIVIERNNVTGGSSRFYENSTIVFDKIMKEGRGIILEENKNKNLYHDVSPIVLKDRTREGYRSIIGIDINFIQ